MSDAFDIKTLKETSKYLSLLLRHDPGRIGLTLDAGGWAHIDEILAKTELPMTRALLLAVVKTSGKQRFALSDDGLRVRANQGHSFPVDLGLSPQTPPETLFHGNARRSVASILNDGLKAMTRQHVHLSAAYDTAQTVGQRHGTPVVLKIKAGKMHRAGHSFYISQNGVWLTSDVPPEFITTPDE